MLRGLIAPSRGRGSARKYFMRRLTFFVCKKHTLCKTKPLHVIINLFPHQFLIILTGRWGPDCYFAFQMHQDEADPSGRYLILSASFNNSPVVIVNNYAPNTHQKCFYKHILGKIQHFPKDHILCRDFNYIVDLVLDSSSSSRKCLTELSSLLQSEGLYES